jgi:hypothetical protein
MTDKERGWSFRPKETEEVPLSAEEPAPVDEVIEEPVEVPEVVEEPVEVPEVAVESAATLAEKQKAGIEAAIKRARESAANKSHPEDRSSAKAELITKKNEELQKKIDSLYTVGVWMGKPNYECTVCSYSTLDETLIRQHVRKYV